MSHSILGIDVGKAGFVVAFPPSDSKTHPQHWPHVAIDYADPRWWVNFLDLVADAATVAAEPTGTHLLTPIAAVLDAYRPNAVLWHVGHKMTEHIRQAQVSSAKTDKLDAIALAIIARDIAAGQPPRNCRPYNHHLASNLSVLRTYVNIHVRLTKESTRAKNRINVLAHSLWPSFAGSDTWLRAVRSASAVTPEQIKELAAHLKAIQPKPEAYAQPGTRSRLTMLARDLPDIYADPLTRRVLLELIAHLDSIQSQLADVAAHITHLIDQPPLATVTRRWRTMPGVNDVLIAALHVATHGDVLNLSQPDFRAAIGVNPISSISGYRDGTKITRKGYRPARTLLHLWAMHLVSPDAADNAIRRYYDNRGRDKFGAAKNKLARVLWGVARDPHL